MKRKFSFLVLLLAFGITFLHSVTPHVHHSDITSEEDQNEHKESNDLADILSLLFHPDEGDTNLENLTGCNSHHQLSDEQFLILFNFHICPSSEEKFASQSFYFVPVIYTGFSTESFNHRGPPYLG